MGIYTELQITETVTELLVQLAICYICWTMGSSAQLRRFNCEIQRSSEGTVHFSFKVKNTSFALVNESSFESSSADLSVEVPIEIQRMKRGQSFENEQGCDEIF